MSNYTTEVRFICENACGYRESKGGNEVDTIVNQARISIFNFNYPIFDTNYKSVLESKILKHFYTREIGFETVGLWKLKLNTKLNEIMPYYNKLYESELLQFNPLYTVNLTRTHNRTDNGTKNEVGKVNETNGETVNNTGAETTNGTTSGTLTDTKWDYYNDTPQGSVDNIENLSYLTNARKDTDNQSTSGTSSVSVNGSDSSVKSGNRDIDSTKGEEFSNTEDYLENVYGYDGRNASKMLNEYRETFLNIDMMVIDELEELFMQLW